MAFKMKNPFKQEIEIEPSVSESTGVVKPVIPVKKAKKCYMTNPKTGERTEIPCKSPVEGKGGEGKVYDPTSKEITEFSKYQRGAGGTFVKHG